MGGLGVRSLEGTNQALIAKVTWVACTQPNHPWVKLVKAKHLRGRGILDSERTKQVSSWIWGYQKQSQHHLKRFLLSSGLTF